MSTIAKTSVWEFPFSRPIDITPIQSSLGNGQTAIILTTAERVNELMEKCQFAEGTKGDLHIGLGSEVTVKNNQSILWRPGDHVKLLDVLKDSITSNTAEKPIEYIII